MRKLFNFKVLLILVFILGLTLRFYRLGDVPSGFHADEASYGYNTYSLLQTGKDEYGKSFPLVLKSFGDYKGALYSYLAMPTVAFLGLTEFAVRLPTAIIGVFFVFLSYLLSFMLTHDKKVSLLTSLLISINPLSILLSRVQSDPLVSIFLVLLGFYCFLLWVEKNRLYLVLLSVFFWILSLYTYPSPRVLLPVLFLGIIIFYFKKISSSQKKILILTLASVVLIDLLVITGVSQRLKQLSVFNAPIVILPMEEKIREDSAGNVLITRSFHNKVVDHFFVISKNYFDYFTYDFLFLKGGQPDREKIPGMGILYIVELPFLLYGVYLVIRSKKKWGKIVVLLILSFPLVLSFAVDESPNVHRFYINIVFLEILVSFGIINFVYNFTKKYPFYFKPILAIMILIFAYNFFYFMHQLFVHNDLHRAWYRGYAYKPLTDELKKLYPKYKKIVVTKSKSSPYIYILFYDKYSPAKYQSQGSPKDLDYTGFDEYYFVPLDCPSEGEKRGDVILPPETGVLYVDDGSCSPPPPNNKILKSVFWEDGNIAFKLVEHIATGAASLK